VSKWNIFRRWNLLTCVSPLSSLSDSLHRLTRPQRSPRIFSFAIGYSFPVLTLFCLPARRPLPAPLFPGWSRARRGFSLSLPVLGPSCDKTKFLFYCDSTLFLALCRRFQNFLPENALTSFSPATSVMRRCRYRLSALRRALSSPPISSSTIFPPPAPILSEGSGVRVLGKRSRLVPPFSSFLFARSEYVLVGSSFGSFLRSASPSCGPNCYFAVSLEPSRPLFPLAHPNFGATKTRRLSPPFCPVNFLPSRYVQPYLRKEMFQEDVGSCMTQDRHPPAFFSVRSPSCVFDGSVLPSPQQRCPLELLKLVSFPDFNPMCFSLAFRFHSSTRPFLEQRL